MLLRSGHSSEMASAVNLRLLGDPQLFVDGEAIDLRPRAIFELAAVIISCGDVGISRVAITRRLWAHLEYANGRQQLRVALHKLRESCVGDFFDLSGDTLRIVVEASVDLHEIAEGLQPNLDEIQTAIGPVAKGWNNEHWQEESDAFGEVIADAFSGISLSTVDQSRFADLLVTATSVHPTTVRLHAMLVAVLEHQSRLAERTEAVIAFEDNWIERFGSADLPDLLDLSREFLPCFSPNTVKNSLLARFSVASLAAIIACVSVVGAFASRSSSNITSPDVSTETTEVVSFAGQDFRVKQLHLTNARTTEIVAFKTLRDGSVAFLTDDQSTKSWIGLPPNQIRSKPLPRSELFDRTTNEEVFTSPFPGEFIQIVSRTSNSSIRGLPMFPRVFPTILLANGKLVFARMCDHPAGCHTRLFLWQEGTERELKASSKAQITVPTAIYGDTIYAKYSLGPKDSWHYHAFRYDLPSGAITALSSSPVIGQLRDRVLITRPESTKLDHGDYQTQPEGRVVVRSKARNLDLAVEGQTKFPAAYTIGDLVLLVIAETNPYSKVAFVDSKSRLIKPFPSLADRVSKIFPDAYGRAAILFRNYKSARPSNDYTLITLVESSDSRIP